MVFRTLSICIQNIRRYIFTMISQEFIQNVQIQQRFFIQFSSNEISSFAELFFLR